MNGEREVDEALRGLAASRGECPPMERLMACESGELSGEELQQVDRHIELCGVCQSLLDRPGTSAVGPAAASDDFTWRRAEMGLDRRAAPWRSRPTAWRRYAGAVAAALVVAVAPAIWFAMRDRTAPGAPGEVSPVERGSAIRPVQPAGRVDRVEEFRWEATPAHASFRVVVMQGETLLWEAPSAAPRLRPAADTSRRFTPGAVYRWKVQGLDDRSQVLDESGWVVFELTR